MPGCGRPRLKCATAGWSITSPSRHTTDSGNTLTARVAQIGLGGELINEWALATERECRGLAPARDGSFAALPWNDAGDDIYVHRYESRATCSARGSDRRDNQVAVSPPHRPASSRRASAFPQFWQIAQALVSKAGSVRIMFDRRTIE